MTGMTVPDWSGPGCEDHTNPELSCRCTHSSDPQARQLTDCLLLVYNIINPLGLSRRNGNIDRSISTIPVRAIGLRQSESYDLSEAGLQRTISTVTYTTSVRGSVEVKTEHVNMDIPEEVF